MRLILSTYLKEIEKFVKTIDNVPQEDRMIYGFDKHSLSYRSRYCFTIYRARPKT